MNYANELLQQVASDLNKYPYFEKCPVSALKVIITNENDEMFEFSLASFLDAVANNLYWDERGNWSDARKAHIEMI